MMVSTKGRYALRVLIDLAEHQTDGYIPLKDTAARQEISEKYIEGIIKILVKAKLLELSLIHILQGYSSVLRYCEFSPSNSLLYSQKHLQILTQHFFNTHLFCICIQLV